MKQNGSRTTNNIFSRRAWRKRYFVLQVSLAWLERRAPSRLRSPFPPFLSR